MENINNIYIESSQKNLEHLLAKGANFGIYTEIGLLSCKFIVTNAYGNMYGYNNISNKPFLLKYEF